MKKIKTLVLGLSLLFLAACSSQDQVLENPELEAKEAQVGEQVALKSARITVEEIDIKKDLGDFPGLDLGEVEEVEEVQLDDQGHLVSAHSLVLVAYDLEKTEDLEVRGGDDRETYVNVLVLGNGQDLYEMDLYNLRQDLGSSDYFMQKMEKGQTLKIKGAFVVPDEFLEGQPLFLHISDGEAIHENNRNIYLTREGDQASREAD